MVGVVEDGVEVVGIQAQLRALSEVSVACHGHSVFLVFLDTCEHVEARLELIVDGGVHFALRQHSIEDLLQ